MWSHIALGFNTGLSPSNDNSVIFTIVDRLSKAAHFVPLSKLPSATETTQLLLHHVVRLHGIPTEVVSDQGPRISSGAYILLGHRGKVSISYKQTERANQHLEATLRCIAAADATSWSSHLPSVEYTFNTQTCAATGLSLFEASVAYQPPMFPEQEEKIVVPSVQQH